MKYCGQIDFLMSAEVKVIEPKMLEAVLKLAESEACSLAAYPISTNSPLRRFTEVQVCNQLIDNLQPFFEAVPYNGTEVMIESGLILAFDDCVPQARRVIGYIDFIPRLFTRITDSTASIGSIVVARSHRNRGVMRGMLAALQARYSVHELDCAVELVSLYERLGYSPVGPAAGGTNVSMSNGVVDGEIWEPSSRPEHKQLLSDTRNFIRKQIGSDKFDDLWQELIAGRDEQKRKVEEFFQIHRGIRGFCTSSS